MLYTSLRGFQHIEEHMVWILYYSRDVKVWFVGDSKPTCIPDVWLLYIFILNMYVLVLGQCWFWVYIPSIWKNLEAQLWIENAIVPLENLKLYCGILRTGQERFGGTFIEGFRRSSVSPCTSTGCWRFTVCNQNFLHENKKYLKSRRYSIKVWFMRILVSST